MNKRKEKYNDEAVTGRRDNLLQLLLQQMRGWAVRGGGGGGLLKYILKVSINQWY